MRSKTCPNCNYRFSVRAFAGLTVYRFTCPDCQADLKGDMRFFLLAVLLVSPLSALSISLAVNNPKFWLLVPVAGLAGFFISFTLFEVTYFKKEAGQGRPD
jgi:hypothetical protein